MKYIQGDAYGLPPRRRHAGAKHMPVTDTATAGRKSYFSRFPLKRVSVEPRRHAKGNNVSWNVIRLDDVIDVSIVKLSPTTKLNINLAPGALGANAVPG